MEKYPLPLALAVLTPPTHHAHPRILWQAQELLLDCKAGSGQGHAEDVRWAQDQEAGHAFIVDLSHQRRIETAWQTLLSVHQRPCSV